MPSWILDPVHASRTPASLAASITVLVSPADRPFTGSVMVGICLAPLDEAGGRYY